MKRITVLFFLTISMTWSISAFGAGVAGTIRDRIMDPLRSSILSRVAVYAHAHLLDSRDKLQDGPESAEITLDGPTLLVWVDKDPLSRFTHPTAYILISVAGVRIVDGHWWPVLNGSRILYGKNNSATIVSPYSIPNDEHSNYILAHFYPEELERGDIVTDGPDNADGVISDRTFLMWVDMVPQAFFAHPTIHILVTADKRIIVRDGSWWPELNGKRVLYGNDGNFSVPFPFRLR